MNSLKAAWLETQLGRVMAVSDDRVLYLLGFSDHRLEHELERLEQKTKSVIVPGLRRRYVPLSINRLPIIVPCHRVINTNGDLGGYSGGVTRKAWLINHEKKI